MRYLEGAMAEIGQIIHRRYLLQRLIKQGQACTVYQGFDQVLQRPVTIKITSAEHAGEYRAAIRGTAQFSHPNIIGIYDLIIEADTLSIVQEYVEGDDFAALLQTQLSPYIVADLGVQICQALIYASSPTRKVCHGDLTPTAIIRDRRGSIRINNFALPSDLHYFTSWSVMGGDGLSISDRELPWGQMTEGRRADDTRAVGLLLYQLLTGRPPGATTIEPPGDGRLRFQRNIPPELCDVVARTVVRQHPKHINTAETLIAELRVLAEAFEPPPTPIATAIVSPQKTDDIVPFQQFSPTKSGKLVTALPARDTSLGLSMLRPEPTPLAEPLAIANSTGIDASPMNALAERSAMYSPMREDTQPRQLNLFLMLLLGLVLFGLFFAIGYFLATSLFTH